MDLGIAGRWAIVCASSQGLGFACAQSLSQEGVNVVINGRDRDRLSSAAESLRKNSVGDVVVVPADLTTADGRVALLEACPAPDILVTNNPGPRLGEIDVIDESDLAAGALDLHYWAPISLVRGVLDGMRERKFGRIINITSAMVTAPRPHMVASAGARAGLTAVMKAISLQVAADNVTINNLLPERIDSPRQIENAHFVMEREGIDFEEARRRQVASIAAQRLGKPEEIGASCAFLCSIHAGYISGMNLRLDGGSYPGLV